jgi:hypothetical protein
VGIHLTLPYIYPVKKIFEVASLTSAALRPERISEQAENATTAEELDIAFAAAAAQRADAISGRNIICPRSIFSGNSPAAD